MMWYWLKHSYGYCTMETSANSESLDLDVTEEKGISGSGFWLEADPLGPVSSSVLAFVDWAWSSTSCQVVIPTGDWTLLDAGSISAAHDLHLSA